jgi:hypothetical protein
MRKAGLLALIATWSGVSVASAHPLYLTGEIGTFPVLLMMEQSENKLAGWYYYLRNGKEIRFEGKSEPDGGFAFDEFSLDGKKTGSFKGTIAQGEWRGSWQKADGGQPLPLSLKENTDTLSDLTAQVDCTAKVPDKKYGYLSATTFRLTASKGEVKRFAMTETSPFKDERTECKLSRNDLVQAKSDAGLLLKAKDNVEGALRQCTIRILATANYFYVSMGDTTEVGNDCKAAGDTWFCGGRGSWPDLIVDRKRGTCIRKE